MSAVAEENAASAEEVVAQMSEITNQSNNLEGLMTELDDFLIWLGAVEESARNTGTARLAA